MRAELGLTVEPSALSFGTFEPGLAKTYVVSTGATVMSTVGGAALTVSGPTRLVNGPAALSAPLDVAASQTTWTGPVAYQPIRITFKQRIGADEVLRAGSYSGAVTFTLVATTP